MYNVKLFFYLLKHYIRFFPKEYLWRVNRVKYYRNRIKDHVRNNPDFENSLNELGRLPLDPVIYPYDELKSRQALAEVNQWIKEEKEHT